MSLTANACQAVQQKLVCVMHVTLLSPVNSLRGRPLAMHVLLSMCTPTHTCASWGLMVHCSW